MKTIHAKLRKLIPLLVIVGSVLVASVVYWTSLLAEQAAQVRDAQHRTELRARQLNAAITQQLDATLRSVDIALKHLRAVHRHNLPRFEQSVQDVLGTYPDGMMQFISVFGPDGSLVYASDHAARRPRSTYVADPEHFITHVGNPEADALSISAPIFGRAPDGAVVLVTRGMWDGNQLLGVIAIALRPDYLASRLVSLRVDPADLLSVVRLDGRMIARSHNLPEALKVRLPAERPYLTGQAGDSGMFRNVSVLDKVPLLFAWHRLEQWPLATVAGVNEEVEMAALFRGQAQARQQALATLALVLAFSLGVGLLMVRIQRKKGELADSEARHRALFEHSKLPMLLIHPQSGHIVDGNDAASSFYGYSRAQLQQLRIADINQLPPDAIQAEMALAREEKRSCFYFPHRLANGEIRQVEVHSGPLEVNGQILLYSFVHDITERKREQEQRVQLLAEQRAILSSEVAGIAKITERRFVWMNRAYAAMLGYSVDELTGQSTRLLYADDASYAAFGEQAYPTLQRGEVYRTEIQYLRKDGTLGWYDICGELLQPGGDESIWSFADITEQRANKLRLERLIAEQKSLLNNDLIGIVTVRDRTILWANPAFEKMLGYGPGELAGKPTRQNFPSDEDYTSFGAEAYPVLAAQGVFRRQIQHLRKDGGRIWLDASAELLNPATGESLWGFVDITQRKQMEDQVRQLAFHDPLTGLPNRRLLLDRLSQAMSTSKRSGRYAAVLFLDLDNFKPLNDAYGHEAGDLLLIEVARRLSACVREIDTIARFGGDEFVVMLSDLHADRQISMLQAHAVAEKIRATLSQIYHLTVHSQGATDVSVEHRCTASVGVTVFYDHQGNSDNILNEADAAMYEAKQAGRNAVCFYRNQEAPLAL